MNQTGFSLVEMLITMVILLFLLLGIYGLFTQGQWLHLASEKRTNIQDNARIVIAQMEDDMRMIGSGNPKSSEVSGTITAKWNPAIFNMTSTAIGFTGDLDGGAVLLTKDAGTVSNDRLYVQDVSYYANATIGSPIPIIVVSKEKRWDDLSVTGIITSSPYSALQTNTMSSPSSFTADKSEVFTMESISYRWVTDTGGTADANSNGECDSGESAPFIPNCVIERAEFRTNNPDPAAADGPTPSSGDWNTFGTHVQSFSIEYLQADGTTAASASAVKRMRVTLTCRDRGMNVGTVQNLTLQSEITIRN
ncbi:prepilin-type N-terminal cleavage/methylation domain-containing protein [bacterium]|nr:prepilin-type N-terminal cleavage/methylation domain-containing protein [bacterium]MCI0602970.1 prepilin-type N-terminal cleavage/methylation domain-containing protein [bacterium]